MTVAMMSILTFCNLFSASWLFLYLMILHLLTTIPYPPYVCVQNIVLLHQLLEGWSGPPKYPHSQVSQQCRDVIEACFQKDSHSRPSADALLLYPWIVAVESHLDDSGLVKGDMSVNSEEGGSVYR